MGRFDCAEGPCFGSSFNESTTSTAALCKSEATLPAAVGYITHPTPEVVRPTGPEQSSVELPLSSQVIWFAAEKSQEYERVVKLVEIIDREQKIMVEEGRVKDRWLFIDALLRLGGEPLKY